MKNEVLIAKNPIKNLDNIYNVSKGTIKIIFKNGDISSGFFLKFERNKKPFHCLMTNEHALTKDRINKKEKIIIKYENEKKELSLELNKEERIILDFKDFNIDISIVEIIPKDKIDDTLFLSPSSNINEEYYINKDIQLIQYPNGENLSISEGKITDLFTSYQYMFYHEASTESGSSGSPIVIKDKETVIGIHKGSINGKKKKKNVGILIGNVIEQLKEYKINNKRKEYYDNGELKYEGNFLNDEYNDNNGLYKDEEGNAYTGKFENGKKNGNFCVIKGDKIIKCEYKDDELVKEEDSKEEDKKENSESKSDDNNNSNNNNNNNSNNNNGSTNYFLTQNFWDKVIKGGYSVLKPLGDKIGYKCGCGHVAKSHTEIELGKWKCAECNSGYCYIECF